MLLCRKKSFPNRSWFVSGNAAFEICDAAGDLIQTGGAGAATRFDHKDQA
jgi:hypothetical protein